MKNLLIISSTVTYPMTTGGHERVYHVANELGKRDDMDVRVYAPYVRKADRNGSDRVMQREHFVEYMSHTPLLQIVDALMSRVMYPRRVYSCLITTIAKRSFVKEALDRADEVVFSRPDLIDMVDGYDMPVSYLSHNRERQMVRDLGYTRGRRLREKQMKKRELALCHRSSHIYVCSDQDAQGYIDAGVEPQKLVLLPNGKSPLPRSKHELEKPALYEGESRPIILFLGSSHLPNQEGLDRIHAVAHKQPELLFVILGSVCKGRSDTANVKHMGFVSEREKSEYMYYAERAINPIRSGGGSSLKVVDYMMHGLPLISSEFGMRGFESYTGYVPISYDEPAISLIDYDDNQPDMLRKQSLELARQYLRESLLLDRWVG